jgi:hypothetical protein
MAAMAKATPTENAWSISKAKANFAAFQRAAEKRPQIITVRGVPRYEIRLLPSWKKSSAAQKKR